MFSIILAKVLSPNLVGGVVPRFSFFIAAVDVDTTSVAVEGRIGHRLTCICFNFIRNCDQSETKQLLQTAMQSR